MESQREQIAKCDAQIANATNTYRQLQQQVPAEEDKCKALRTECNRNSKSREPARMRVCNYKLFAYIVVLRFCVITELTKLTNNNVPTLQVKHIQNKLMH